MSALAQPGAAPGPELGRWFWEDTAAGRALLALHPVLAHHDNPDLRRLARDYLVPRVQAHQLGGSHAAGGAMPERG